MKSRKSNSSRRQRRRRLAFQLLATMGLAFAGPAVGADDGYFSRHEPITTPQLFRLSDQETLVATQPPPVIELAPATDELEVTVDEIPPAPPVGIEGDDFLADSPSDLAPPATSDDAVDADVPAVEAVDADVQAIVEASQSPVPAPAPPTARSNRTDFGANRFAFGATAGSRSVVPNMMGDHFGGLNLIGSMFGATVALGGGDRRFKVAENVSPIPQDRIYFNYNHFENALVDVNQDKQSLDRFTFGFEKTFLDGLASFEMRVPFSAGLNSTQTFSDFDTQNAEFGNLAFALKGNLISGENWILSGGASMTVPTGDDFVLLFSPGSPFFRVKNDAVHLAPFLGYLTQHDKWFAQGFLQADFDLNGNDVISFGNTYEGKLQDQNLLFADFSLGRWLYQNRSRCSHLTGIAAIAELHYTTTLNDSDDVFGINNPNNRMDFLNATGGLAIQCSKTTLRVGAAAPLRGDEEQLFDAEVIFQLNRFF